MKVSPMSSGERIIFCFLYGTEGMFAWMGIVNANRDKLEGAKTLCTVLMWLCIYLSLKNFRKSIADTQ